MQNGEGLKDKAPSYIEEKFDMLTSGYDAFSYLDYMNMTKVVQYLNDWHIELPLPIKKEWELQNNALQDLNL